MQGSTPLRHARASGRPHAAPIVTFNALWLAETIRLREAQWGPLEDAAEVRASLAAVQGFAPRILHRASLLARREKLDQTLLQWGQASRLALGALCLLAILAGAAAAAAALGDGSRPVNLLLAFTALLGLHFITLAVWLMSFLASGVEAGAWLGRLWLWLTRKLARGPDVGLPPTALASLLGRRGGLPWLFGSVSHGFWVIAFTSALATLLALLSTRRYTFNWETTLLSPDTFVSLTTGLGWLPGLLGFGMPDPSTIQLSNGLNALPPQAQALWSGWLIGCVVAYGFLPRLLCATLCFALIRRKVRALDIDLQLPGYMDLRERLDPPSEPAGIDAPPPAFSHATGQGALFDNDAPDTPIAFGLELPEDLAWPPFALPDSVRDLGIVDTREQRNGLLDRLQGRSPNALLIACDRRQTPDRGSIGFIASAARLAGRAHVLLVPSGEDARDALWLTSLLEAGFAADQISADPAVAQAWLQARNKEGGGHVRQ